MQSLNKDDYFCCRYGPYHIIILIKKIPYEAGYKNLENFPNSKFCGVPIPCEIGYLVQRKSQNEKFSWKTIGTLVESGLWTSIVTVRCHTAVCSYILRLFR